MTAAPGPSGAQTAPSTAAPGSSGAQTTPSGAQAEPAATTGPPRIDGDRLLGRVAELGAVGADEGGGVTRLAWSPADREAVALVASWAGATGARVHVDAAGTLIAERPGTVPGLAPLAMGSHLDTVIQAGRLDGAYGVVVGVEILAALDQVGAELRHPLRVAAFANEEGVTAPPFTGSRAAAGVPVAVELERRGPDGVTLRQRMAAGGGDPEGLAATGWGPLAGYLEVHIEQGPVLDVGGHRVGVVTAITGQARAQVEWTGRANHAGTTPMGLRRDALVAAAHGVLAVEGLAVDGVVAVATVGRLEVEPGVPNVVPASVRFSVDVRSVDDERAAAAMARLGVEVRSIAARTGTEATVVPTSSSAAVATSECWRRLLTASAATLGVASVEMASGAGHDAQHMAALGPVGVLFVPSIAGVSHHPSEDTAPADLVLGARIALDAILAADRAFDA